MIDEDRTRTGGDEPEELADEIEAHADVESIVDPELLREWARIIRQFKRKWN